MSLQHSVINYGKRPSFYNSVAEATVWILLLFTYCTVQYSTEDLAKKTNTNRASAVTVTGFLWAVIQIILRQCIDIFYPQDKKANIQNLYLILYVELKGSVSQDFRPPVFS